MIHTAPWERGTAVKASYHLPGFAVLLSCSVVNHWVALGEEAISLLAKCAETLEIFSLWNTVHFAGILCFA